MKIGIFNRALGNKSDITDKFTSLLTEKSVGFFFMDCNSSEKPDVIVVFGGDGTILSAAKTATFYDAPVFAVNTGTIGFLSSFETSELETAVDCLLSGKYGVSPRSSLKITVGNDEYFALNDAVIERDKAAEENTVISKINLSIGGQSVYDLSADGIIISTPTGSTAYSLSAGGVILTPDLKSFIATPICSHSLSSRPVVYDDGKTATVTLLNSSCSCILSLDGRPIKKLKTGDKVFVSKNEKTFKLIEKNDDFFNRLVNKLG